MQIEKKPVDQLLCADYNPRKELKPGDPEYEKLRRSLEQFGYVEPVIWNRRTRTIVGGHQRLSCLKDMGITEIDCVVVDFDLEKEKALNIALNKISGEWDKEKLALLITDLQADAFDVSLTGFDPNELDDLFKSQTRDDIHEDEFDVDEQLKKPVFSKPGDIWKLGRHRLICADSTKPETYDLLLLGEKANLVFSDLPYGVNYKGKAGKIKNDNLKDEEFYSFLLAAFKCMHSVMADDASIYIFHADIKGLPFRRAFFDAGFYLSECCIWKKNRFVLGRSPYQWQHESCLYGWKQKGRLAWYSDRKQSTIWEFDSPARSKQHPTMKPVELCAYPIMNSTLTNSLVLDPFGGSGSTLIACEQTGRICRMAELDPKFCDVIINRYIEQTGSSAYVTCQRDGLSYSYDEIAQALCMPDSQ